MKERDKIKSNQIKNLSTSYLGGFSPIEGE
jgi:hypothetical protein